MRRTFVIAAALVVALTCHPAFAQSTPATGTSPGVQVIDMNPQASHKKSGTAPAAKPKPSSTPAELPYGALLVKNAMAFVGTPFKKGGMSPKGGFDSAGFTSYAYSTIGFAIPRLAPQQFFQGRQIQGDPLPGDLVFFQTVAYGPSEVGIYIGNAEFVTSDGPNVHVVSFGSDYYKKRYLGARRFLPG